MHLIINKIRAKTLKFVKNHEKPLKKLGFWSMDVFINGALLLVFFVAFLGTEASLLNLVALGIGRFVLFDMYKQYVAIKAIDKIMVK